MTVTDANLFLGRLLPERFLGGRMPLAVAESRAALEALARKAGLAPNRLAQGILEVAEATMAGALRVVSVQRGHDPRDFALLPFGGAGGLHACALAEALGMDRIFLPRHPGLLSAVGLVLADTVRDYSQTVLRTAPVPQDELEAGFAPLAERAQREMAAEGIVGEDLTLEPSLDVRYRGQSFEVNVPFGADWPEAFHRRHEELYSHRDEGRQLEVVTLRLRARGRGPRPKLGTPPPVAGPEGPLEERPVVIAGEEHLCPVYERADLPAHARLAGPALVVEETATHLVAPGWHLRVDELGNLWLERETRGGGR